MARQPEWQSAEYGMFLDCPYNEDFIDEMKQVVPREERRWDKHKRMWWISDLYLDEVDNLLFSHFEVTGYGRD